MIHPALSRLFTLPLGRLHRTFRCEQGAVKIEGRKSRAAASSTPAVGVRR